MIDFHNHVLPNVDDGPQFIDESLDMLRCASKQGIKKVINTVHFQHPKMENKNVDNKYLLNQLDILQKAINDNNIDIELYLAAEVFYLPNLVEISSNPILTIGLGKYMLIEFTTNIYPTGFENILFDLQIKGITPIIAHPERYRFIQKDIKILESWLDKGYILQVDAGSVLGFFGLKTKGITLKMIKNGFIHLMGSDAHNNKKRNFCLSDAYDEVAKLTSIDFVNMLKQNSSNLLDGKKIEKISSNIMTENKFSYLKEKIINRLKF